MFKDGWLLPTTGRESGLDVETEGKGSSGMDAGLILS